MPYVSGDWTIIACAEVPDVRAQGKRLTRDEIVCSFRPMCRFPDCGTVGPLRHRRAEVVGTPAGLPDQYALVPEISKRDDSYVQTGSYLRLVFPHFAPAAYSTAYQPS